MICDLLVFRLEEHALRRGVGPRRDLGSAVRVESETGDENHVVEHVGTKDVVDDAVTGHETDLGCERVGVDHTLHHHGDVRAEHDAGVVVLSTLVAEESVLQRILASAHVILGLGAGVAVDRETAADGTDLGNASLIGVHRRTDREALEIRKHLKECANARSCNDEVGSATAVVHSHAVGLDDDLGVERAATLAEPTTVGLTGIPEGNAATGGGGLVASLDADVDHAGEHLAIDLSLNLVGEGLGHLVVDVNAVHRLEVLLKLGRPVGGDTTGTGLNCGLLDLDGHLGDASGHLELREQTSDASILLDEERLLDKLGLLGGAGDGARDIEGGKRLAVLLCLNAGVAGVEEVVPSFHAGRGLLGRPLAVAVGILAARLGEASAVDPMGLRVAGGAGRAVVERPSCRAGVLILLRRVEDVAVERLTEILVAEGECQADRAGHGLNADNLVRDQLGERTTNHRDDDLRHAGVTSGVTIAGEGSARRLLCAKNAARLGEVLVFLEVLRFVLKQNCGSLAAAGLRDGGDLIVLEVENGLPLFNQCLDVYLCCFHSIII